MNTEVIEIFSKEDPKIFQVVDCLKKGNVVALPTETVYGLAASIHEEAGLEQIFKAKGRPSDNPLIVHVDSINMASTLGVDIPPTFYCLAQKFWPGPLTLIVKRSSKISSTVSAGLDSVALRMPNHPVMLRILQELQIPLAAPSANLSGAPSPTKYQHVIQDLYGKIPMIVSSYDCEVGIESTVVSLLEEIPVIVRPGIISLETLRQVVPAMIELPSISHEDLGNHSPVSPGLKYKHYAPQGQLILVLSTLEKFCEFLEEKKQQNIWVIHYENESFDFGHTLTLGNQEKEEDLSKHLFSVLRQLDAEKAPIAYLRITSEIQNFSGFYNRLLRAASFQVITV